MYTLYHDYAKKEMEHSLLKLEKVYLWWHFPCNYHKELLIQKAVRTQL